MFSRILVANRGEIALRVIRACKEVGLETVAVYSEADGDSLHLELSDQKVCIGPAVSAKSYLNIESIVDAAKSTGADAIHPGYGYLAENRAFAARCEERGIAFIGPTPSNLGLAGDKITVKGYAEEKVVSDAGTWRGTVTVRAADLRAGYRELEEDTGRVLKLLESTAGTGGTVSMSPVTSRPQYEVAPGGAQTGRVVGYEFDRTFELNSNDVALVTRVAAGASTLISEGVNINSWPPQYFFRDLNPVKVRLIGAATRDAQLRAEQFAAGSGVTVGALRSATQGVFQITRPNSTETADYGSYDTSTVEKVVKAVVTVEYSVARKP